MNLLKLEQMITVAKEKGASATSEVYVDCYECINIVLPDGSEVANSHDKGIILQKGNDITDLIRWEE